MAQHPSAISNALMPPPPVPSYNPLRSRVSPLVHTLPAIRWVDDKKDIVSQTLDYQLARPIRIHLQNLPTARIADISNQDDPRFVYALSQNYPKAAIHCVHYDGSTAASNWPQIENVTHHTKRTPLAAFGTDWDGVFDVVVVRYRLVLGKEVAWYKGLKAFLSLLKPGGYIQWVHRDSDPIMNASVQKKERTHGPQYPGCNVREIHRGWYMLQRLGDLLNAPPLAMWELAVQASVLESFTEDHKMAGQLIGSLWLPYLCQDMRVMCDILCEFSQTLWTRKQADEYLDASEIELRDGVVWLFPEIKCWVAKKTLQGGDISLVNPAKIKK